MGEIEIMVPDDVIIVLRLPMEIEKMNGIFNAIARGWADTHDLTVRSNGGSLLYIVARKFDLPGVGRA